MMSASTEQGTRRPYSVWGAAVLIALLLAAQSAPVNATTRAEAACHDNVQGRIAADYSGNTRWRRNALSALCAGTRRPRQPGLCFEEVLRGGVDWGGGTRWQPRNAIALCGGSNGAIATVRCFDNALQRSGDWRSAIARCGATDPAPPGDRRGSHRRQTASCQALIQGRIAWNLQGNTRWERRYLDSLCANSRFPREPGRCYDLVMHGRVNWGEGTRWEPDNALRLCAGSEFAIGTVECFEDIVSRGRHWREAIRRCAAVP